MTEIEKHALLAKFADHQSEAAFATIVSEHVNLVYSTALRSAANPHHAEEITQAVFVLLARKAGSLSANVVLSGWLYQTTRLTAANFLKGERRRQQRELEACMQSTLNEPDAEWERLTPLLDDAMGHLGETDRAAIVLRFFENKTAAEVAATLQITEAAAQKRISRAMERLRGMFAKRGVTVGAGGLAVVLSANAVQAAPVGLALTISTAAALTGTTLATTATATATKALAMTALQKTIVAATIAVLAGAGIYEARQASQLRHESQTLQQQTAFLVEQNGQLLRERDAATQQLAALRNDNERLTRTPAELLKLRGEVARLRAAEFQQETDSTASTAATWLNRVHRLKTHIEQNQALQIPELEFARDSDWLDVVKEDNLEAEDGLAKALEGIRERAKLQVARVLYRALTDYLSANEGKFPVTLSQLQPYLAPPLPEACLERWEIKSLKDFPKVRIRGDWVVVNKPTLPIERNDERVFIGMTIVAPLPPSSLEISE
jgi:RNA polymerase sigma factor (sigma-70 family)